MRKPVQTILRTAELLYISTEEDPFAQFIHYNHDHHRVCPWMRKILHTTTFSYLSEAVQNIEQVCGP